MLIMTDKSAEENYYKDKTSYINILYKITRKSHTLLLQMTSAPMGSPCKKNLSRIIRKRFFCYHGNRDGIPAVCELFSYSTTFGVPETGRVPVRMKVSTRPKTRSLPQKCPRAMEARNSGRRSSKRRSKAGSRVIMSACMP